MPALELYLPKSPSGNSLRPSGPSTAPTILSGATVRASSIGSFYEKLVEILVFGCVYERIADEERSQSTLRRRREE